MSKWILQKNLLHSKSKNWNIFLVFKWQIMKIFSKVMKMFSTLNLIKRKRQKISDFQKKVFQMLIFETNNN